MSPSQITTAAGETAWIAAHPGSTHADFIAQQNAEQSFAAASGGTLTAGGITYGSVPDFPGTSVSQSGVGSGTQTLPAYVTQRVKPTFVPVGGGESGGESSTPSEGCPPGYFDGGDGWCYPYGVNPPVSCPSGFIDDGTGICVPAGNFGGGGGGVGSGGGPANVNPPGSGEGPIFITINQNSSITNSAIRAVASSVASGIDAAANQASSIAKQTTDTITSDLSAFTQSFSTWQSGVSQGIQQAILSDLASFVNPLAGELTGINNQTSAITGLINDISGKLIGPISSQVTELNGVLTGSFSALTSDLDQLVGPLGGLVHDFTTLAPFLAGTAGAINDIDKVLAQIAGIWTNVHSTLSGQIVVDLHNMAETLAGVFKQISTVYDPNIKLTTACEPAAALEWMQAEVNKYNTDSIWSRWIADGIGLILTSIVSVFHIMERYHKIYTEIDNRACPLTRLDPGTVAQAAGRSILDETSARDELLSQGFSQARQDVLFAMTRFLEPPAYALEGWFRGVTSDSDLAKILSNNGYSQAQIDAAKELATAQLPIPAAVQAWLRGDIDEGELNKILNAQKYNNDQITFIKAEALRPASASEALLGHRNRDFIGSNTLDPSDTIDIIPDWFIQAAKSDGLNDDATRLAWWSSLNRLDPLTWVQMYFKTLRDLPTVRNALASFGIPFQYQIDFIDNLRPLIPFRSLGTLVKAGYMSPQQAKDELGKHGFDQTRVDILGKTFDAVSPNAAAKTASTVKGESIANARAAFDDGLITSDQYTNILILHGYTQELAAAQVQVDQMKTELKKRKQAISDLEAQVEAGTVTQDDAVAQLHQLGATDAEIAHFDVAVRRTNTQKVKHPSISDLNKFFSAKLITATQYSQELIAQGWQDPWLTAFLNLEVNKQTSSNPPVSTP